MSRITERRRVVHLDDAAAIERVDTLVAEEPLEIRVASTPIAVTMRTPGDDFDLVAGFAWTEGLLTQPDHLSGLRYCAGADADGRNTYNVIDLVLTDDAPAIVPSVGRNFYTTSSCGVCGKASIDAVRTRSAFPVAEDRATVPVDLLAGFPDRLRAEQAVFDKTGGLHAAGLFDMTSGELLAVREDIGRHNAVDKVIGWAAADGRVPLRGTALMVSGRASFELTQKALMAGIPLLAAVSAPSSLGVELAVESGMSLVGFLRGSSMVIYAGRQRIGDEMSTNGRVDDHHVQNGQPASPR